MPNHSDLARFARDTGTGLALFATATLVLAGPSAVLRAMDIDLFSSAAHAAPLLALSAQPVSLAVADPKVAIAMLAVAFATMFALNCAFVRHLRRAYVPSGKRPLHRTESSP
jgi:hypothetical protein